MMTGRNAVPCAPRFLTARPAGPEQSTPFRALLEAAGVFPALAANATRGPPGVCGHVARARRRALIIPVAPADMGYTVRMERFDWPVPPGPDTLEKPISAFEGLPRP
jgi:hypothetical protein